jgi:hypothetical protein
MVKLIRIRFAAAGLSGLCFAVILRAQGGSAEPSGFLRNYIHLSNEQISSLDRGQAVAKILESGHPLEFPSFGAIRAGVPGAFLIEKYRDIAAFKKSKEVVQIGKFHSPPQPEDLDALILDQGDIDGLKKCAVGDCTVKLPAPAIERFRKEVNWAAPDYSKQAAILFRRILFETVRDFSANGNAALPVYGDKKVPIALADESISILQGSAFIAQYAPELDSYLRTYPRPPLERAEEFFYWSKEKFGYKAVISLTHTTIYRPIRSDADWTFIASRQIYASHYFSGSLGLAIYVEPKGPQAKAHGYLIYLNRSRVDLPQGLFSGLIRFIVKRRVLDGMEKYLRVIKEKLESDYRAQSASGK